MRLVLFAVLVAAHLAAAQFPIGRATPVGGYSPKFFCDPLWASNGTFTYWVEGAPPGGQAAFAVSLGRHDSTIAGLAIYPDLDPSRIIDLGAAPVDANGRATFLRSAPGPEMPQLAGLDFYAQAAVSDPATPGVLGSAQGLLVESMLRPMFAYRTSTSSILLHDATNASTAMVAGFTSLPSAAVFANGGRDLFVATPAGLYVVDPLAAAPAGVLLRPGPCVRLAWDRVHDRLYLTTPSTIDVVDGNRSSTGFGTTLAQVAFNQAGIAVAPSGMALAADGHVLAVVSPDGALFRFDGDPQSPSYLAPLPTAPSPVIAGFGTYLGAIDVRPDGRVVSIPVLNLFGGCALYQYDADANQWIDRDPNTSGIQPLSASTDPAIPISWTMLFERNGSGGWLLGLAGVVRIGFDLAAPAFYTLSASPMAPPTLGVQYLSISPSGRFLVQRAASVSQNLVQLMLVDTASLQSAAFATLLGEPWFDASGFAIWR